jgi:hypothetical protein
MRMTQALTASLLAAIAGCAKDDFATVTIEYQPSARRGELSLEPPQKQRVAAAFTQVAKEYGYRCRPHIKRVEEIQCTGPKKMNIRFHPDLNRPRYIATLNWLEVGDRSATEFNGHVAAFVESMRVAIADPSIGVSVANERIE